MAKKIVLCCDGTWNKPEGKKGGGMPTNVLKIVRAILPSDSKGDNQIVYYDQGIGTGGLWDRFVGGATGWGISKNIRDTYRFLANNYNDDDEIYCFGFSRGAYTIRSFGGLLNTIGIMDKSQLGKLSMVYEYYKKHPDKRHKLKFYDEVQELIKTTKKVRMKFMGVWDTVGALGAPTPLLGLITRWFWVSFHETGLENVDYAYHALAIDERRGPFKPSVWTDAKNCQEMKQVWFPGAHSNVGGGYADARIADLAFAWMVKMATASGLEFNRDYIENEEYVNPGYEGKVYNSFSIFYHILRKYLRPIGKKYRDVEDDKNAVNEFMHQSAIDRYNKELLTYNPKNLKYGVENLPVENN